MRRSCRSTASRSCTVVAACSASPSRPSASSSVGDGALALLQYLQALVELHLQFLQDALTLLLDALLDRVFLDASQRSAQAAARAGLCGLIEAVLETAVMGFVCDGASLSRGFLSTDAVRSLRGV